MTPKQNLFYALGEMSYAIAAADGTIQRQEKDALHKILTEEFKHQEWDFDYSEIIFQILQKDKTNLQTAYEWALNEMKNNADDFNYELRSKFVKVIEKVAEAFPPVTKDEKNIIDKFILELTEMKGK